MTYLWLYQSEVINVNFKNLIVGELVYNRLKGRSALVTDKHTVTEWRFKASSLSSVYAVVVVVLSTPVSIKLLCLSACDAAWHLFVERMMRIHHLFNLLSPALPLFFSSRHCSSWFIQSLSCHSLSPSLVRAHHNILVDWDSMYPEKVN